MSIGQEDNDKENKKMADLIDGKAFAAKIRAEVKEDSDKLISQKQTTYVTENCYLPVKYSNNFSKKPLFSRFIIGFFGCIFSFCETNFMEF